MAESTARAERFESIPASAPLFYVWEVPQKPLVVRLGLDAAERLDREVAASFRSVSDRGSEIGGILLGRVLPGSPPTVVVEGYERVACDYSRGPLYRLGAADMARFDALLRQRASGAGDLVVVGMFRSNTRKGLSFDAEDMAFFAPRFPAPHQVALLVRPFATRPSVAGVFIWENGSIQGEASYLEFPVSRPELLKQSVAVGPDGQAVPFAGTPPAAAASKPAVRAQVVPIASRREPVPARAAMTLPEVTVSIPVQPAQVAPAAPEAAAAPAPPAVPEAVSPPAAEPLQHVAEPAPAAAEEKPGPGPARQAVAADPPPPQAAPAPEATPAAPVPFDFSLDVPAPRSGKWIWIACASAAALLLAGGLFFYPGFLVRRGPAPAAASAASGSLDLRVERNAGQLLLTWNRESESVKTATKAVLTIVDGPQRENVDLDLAQLRNGSVVYSPATSDVNFRLDVTSSKPEWNRSELVRVLGTRPSPMPAQGTPAVAAPAATELAGEPAGEPAADAAGEPAAAPVATSPRKNLAAPSERLRPATPADLPEPPSVGGVAVPPAPGLPLATTGLPAPPPAPAAAPAPAPAAAAPAPAAAAPRRGGSVQGARLLRRVEPVYPTLARQTRVRGSVEIQATIGPDGKVKKVEVVSGHAMLRQAAADAVSQWTYSPTLLNGTPVEVVTRVTVGFNLGN